MKHILNFYKKHKFAAVLTALWFAFMIYITATGVSKDTDNIIPGILAGIIMFVPVAIIIDIICAILGKIFRSSLSTANMLKAQAKAKKNNNPIVPQSYTTPAYEPNPAPRRPVLPNYDTMEGHDFEYFCAGLLRKDGFTNVEVTKGSGDQGIDIIAEKGGIKYGIQCKCYSSNIGNSAVQQAFAGKTFYGCHVAVVLTNRFFTTSAKALAEQNKVLLWDRDYLQALVNRVSINNAPA